MIIDIANIIQNTVEHFKNGEKYIKTQIYTDENGNKVMLATIDPGCSIGYHEHEQNYEFVYMLEGNVVCKYDDQNNEEILKEGQIHYCPKGHSHSMKNVSNKVAKILCFIPNK